MQEIQSILHSLGLKHDLNDIRERAFHPALDRRLRGEAANPGADWLEAELQLRRGDELLAIHLTNQL